MAKVFDVDKYLTDNGVTVVIKGKEYTVNDIPFGIQDKLKDTTEEGQKAALSEIIGCKTEELASYGMAAIGAIIKGITENLFQTPSQENQSEN